MHSSRKSETGLERTSNETQSRPTYRPAKPIPYELREHCVIYFEEELYTQALTLLLNLLVAGTSAPTPVPAFVAPPQHLALAATLVVHLSLTTRARAAERLQAATLALRLLRHTHRLVGPVNADFDAAFAFTYFNTSRRGGDGRSSRRRARSRGDDCSPGSGDDPETINSEIANAGSVWARAEDFWQVVGWAFNCSVVHAKRWVRWKVWLEFMVEVLEDDWGLRESMAAETEGESAEQGMERSLIARYLRLEGGKLGGNRRVVRAVFADGGTKALNEFTEVFRNETKGRRKGDGVMKRPEQKVNVEEGEFADYLEDDGDEEEDDDDVGGNPALESTAAPGKDAASNMDDSSTDGSALLGGMDSLTLRLRLLALLSSVSDTLPAHFLPIGALYDLYNDHIRPLPIATFQLFTSPSPAIPTFSPVARSALNQFILRSLIASSAPNPPTDDLDQDLLERYFLPYAANTASVADNAKVSLLLESLLMLVLRYIGVRVTDGLEQAVRVGIEAREKKGCGDRKKRAGARNGEEENRAWLVGSGDRLKAFLEVCKE